MTLRYHSVSGPVFPPPPGPSRLPLLIDRGLHVLNREVYRAIMEDDEAALVTHALRRVSGGAGALAVNLGPGREMRRRTPRVMQILLDHLDVPLFVSSGLLSFPDCLEEAGGRLTVNAVTAEPGELQHAMQVAEGYGIDLVVLLVRPGMIPAGVDECLQVAMEVLDLARATGFPVENLYLDPVLTGRVDPLAWKISRGMPDTGVIAESLHLIKELAAGVRTIISLEMGGRKSSSAREFLLKLLTDTGLDAVIADSLDPMPMNSSWPEGCRIES